MEMHPLFLFLDPCLIWFYRLTGHGLADFLLGTLVLAVIAVIIGEISLSLAFLASRKRLDKFSQEALKYQDLSLEALKAGNKEAYRAANKLANDSFGHSFFMQFTLSAAFLWPVFCALAWMNYRFAGLEFPLFQTGYSFGYIGMFILVYVAAYLLFKKAVYKLPYFRRLKEILKMPGLPSPQVQSLAEPRPQAADGTF